MPLVMNHNFMAANAARNLSSHYGSLHTSVGRLSSGLRIGSAADDAAGLAIRELMRADIATLTQGMRNANDAISMVQTADGALQVIDDILIRMKELALQAATGTYDSTQRHMIDSEFQSMAQEIDRIAHSTEFNGIKLLDGSLSGQHDGSRLSSSGAAKIHFGTGNDSQEDYYYIDVKAADTVALGLATVHNSLPGHVDILSDKLPNGVSQNFPSGLVTFAVIPRGTQNLTLHLNDLGRNDSLQIFSLSGEHLVGTHNSGDDWTTAGIHNASDIATQIITEANGFLPGAIYDDSKLNNNQTISYSDVPPYTQFTVNSTAFGYSGEIISNNNEYLTIEEAGEHLLVLAIGSGQFSFNASWSSMPTNDGPLITPLTIETQSKAQQALEKIDNAIVEKDNIRAHLGAIENRLMATVDNLSIQAENLHASESRISDTDVSIEMTHFVRNQILTQSATAMLSQANSLPKMALQLLG